MIDQILCRLPETKVTDLVVNVFLHVLILLIIVSVFFFAYVSKFSTEKFKGEMGDIVDQTVGSIEKADKDGIVKKVLQQINFDPMITYYRDNPDKAGQTQNHWLKTLTIVSIAIVAFVIFLLLLGLSSFCRKVPYMHILKENFILFSAVGTVEVLFFLFIARNYVPVQPSEVSRTMINRIRSDFSA